MEFSEPLLGGLEKGMTELNGWPGMRTSEKNFQGIGAGL